MGHHPEERSPIIFVKTSEFIVAETREIIANTETDPILNDVVDLDERTVEKILSEGVA